MRRVMESLAHPVPYVHHGRSPQGLDCIGLIFWVYRQIGLSIDHLDVPYSENDAHRPTRVRQILRQLAKTFDRLHPFDPLLDGDVVLIRNDGKDANHLGLFMEGRLWHMSGKSIAPIALYRIAAHIDAAFRHRALN